ncbi:MAG: hypothetical protein QT05_C0052G0049 [archaeon GW2011_AR13]|nr:MAG: hypothetical protein QT05_C0052G0049 [archaeon GW2011_AR13]HIG94280.1 hypothetical protein [Nanoarchaeota archaeon]HIH63179.1 hypothetical protein [Nanoarchaeota archaeon]HIJ09204.1 hypothetical protein [Nanoarchaeota archaeon]
MDISLIPIFEGLILNLIGTILIALSFKFGFSTNKEDEDFLINDKRPVVWDYKNDNLLVLGWIILILGYFFQILSVFS